jgi:hypothetical protein
MDISEPRDDRTPLHSIVYSPYSRPHSRQILNSIIASSSSPSPMRQVRIHTLNLDPFRAAIRYIGSGTQHLSSDLEERDCFDGLQMYWESFLSSCFHMMPWEERITEDLSRPLDIGIFHEDKVKKNPTEHPVLRACVTSGCLEIHDNLK